MAFSREIINMLTLIKKNLFKAYQKENIIEVILLSKSHDWVNSSDLFKVSNQESSQVVT